MDTPEAPTVQGTLDQLATDARGERATALRALQVVEYALAAPAPRRQRTWLHRVTVAVDALHAALRAQLPRPDDPLRLLDEIALCHPDRLVDVRRLQQELVDLTIAVASLREQIEPDPAIDVDPSVIRNRLGALAQRFREHQAREADLVHDVTGKDVDRM